MFQKNNTLVDLFYNNNKLKYYVNRGRIEIKGVSKYQHVDISGILIN